MMCFFDVGSESWIKSLSLTKQDENILINGKSLTADHVYGAQLLLKKTTRRIERYMLPL